MQKIGEFWKIATINVKTSRGKLQVEFIQSNNNDLLNQHGLYTGQKGFTQFIEGDLMRLNIQNLNPQRSLTSPYKRSEYKGTFRAMYLPYNNSTLSMFEGQNLDIHFKDEL